MPHKDRGKRRAYQKAYCAAHREEERVYARAYYAAHREEERAHVNAYHAAHREEQRVYQKAYRATHREERRASAKAYYAAHCEEAKAYAKAWCQANPERSRATGSRYRARKVNARGAAYTTSEHIAARWKFYGDLCYICGAPAEATDHVIALAAGGSHWPANLRPVCTSCNCAKGARPLGLTAVRVPKP